MNFKKLLLIKIAIAITIFAAVGIVLFQVIQQKSSETKSEVERYSTVQRRITDSTCPKCNGAMENGFIVDRGHSGSYISTWVQGTPKEDSGSVNTEPGSPVVTMRCKACGFLESYAK